MIAAPLFALALAAQAAGAASDRAVATPKRVLARVAACGVKAGDAQVAINDVLQEAVVVVRAGTALSDAQLGCLARASADTQWFVTFDAATDARYEPLYAHASEVASLARAQTWVAAHGLTSRVRRFDPVHDDRAAAAARIEALCGAPSHSFPTFATPEEQERAVPPSSLSDDMMICLFDVALVSGMEMGFVGNEAEGPAPRR